MEHAAISRSCPAHEQLDDAVPAYAGRHHLVCPNGTLRANTSSGAGSLKLQAPLVLHGSFNRPNIALEVRRDLLLHAWKGGRALLLHACLVTGACHAFFLCLHGCFNHPNIALEVRSALLLHGLGSKGRALLHALGGGQGVAAACFSTGACHAFSGCTAASTAPTSHWRQAGCCCCCLQLYGWMPCFFSLACHGCLWAVCAQAVERHRRASHGDPAVSLRPHAPPLCLQVRYKELLGDGGQEAVVEVRGGDMVGRAAGACRPAKGLQ